MQEIDFHRALHRPGTIIDAGAHDGRLTLPLAALPGTHVIAFEPLPAAFTRLRANTASVRDRVTLRAEALSDSAGAATLSVPTVGGTAQEEWASVTKDYQAIRGMDARVESIHTYHIRTVPLDALKLSDVTAIKIDVEGAEEEAVAGAVETLRRSRPILSIEIEERHRVGSTHRVPALLRPLGYQGWFEFYGEWRPVESLDVETMQKGSPSPASFEVSHPYVFTFYFVTSERQAELRRLARLP